MCQLGSDDEGPVVLRDGRELPAAPPPRAAAAGVDGAARQVLGAVRLQFGQRAALVHDRATGPPGHLLGLDGPGRREQPVREARTASTPWPWSASCSRTASACSARRSSAWRTTRRRISTRSIDYAVRHDTDFHQFMLYTPIPGTPLHAELTAQGRMKDESEYDVGRHPRAVRSSTTAIRTSATARKPSSCVRAFDRDFERQRPEHRADRPDHAGRLETVQEPSRTCGSAAALPGKPASWARRSRPWCAATRATTATTRRCTRRCSPAAQGAARASSAGSRGCTAPWAAATCC